MDALLTLGLEARTSGENEKALSLFQNAALKAPRNPRLKLEIAKTLRDIGRINEARLCCQNILQAKPEWSPALLMLGSIAFSLEDFATAVANFEAAARLNPLDLNTQVKIAWSFLKLGRIEEAEVLCSRLLDQQPDHRGVLHICANLAEQRGDIARAITYLESLVAIDPDKAEPSLGIVNLLRRADRIAEAEARCRELLRRRPGLPEAAHVLGVILLKRNNFEAALEQLNIAAAQKPSDLNFQLSLANALRNTNHRDEARSIFNRILEISPDNLESVLGLANIAREQMESHEAIARFQQAARLDPADPAIRLEIAFILFDLLRRDEAEAMVKESETCGAIDNRDHYFRRKFEYFCHTEQWERAAKCLTNWPCLRDLPVEMIPSATRYFVERGKWDELLDFFQARIVDGGWSAKTEPTEDVLDFVALGARQTGRYVETLASLDKWRVDGTEDLVTRLRDQLNEEIALLHAVEAIDEAAVRLAGPISDDLRKQRHAVRRRLLAPERQYTKPIVNSSQTTFQCGQQSRDTLFYCTDAGYLLPTAVSLFSLLRHNYTLLPPCRLIVWCSPDALAFASDVLGAVAEYFGRQIEVLSSSTLFSTGLRFRTKFGVFTGRVLSEAAYYRIFAAIQLSGQHNTGRALYIDADTCCAEGIDRLLAYDMQGRPLAARREFPDLPGVLRSSIRLGLVRGEYFNSGILLFDLALSTLQPALESSLNVALQQQHLLTNLDQCALNLGFRDQVTSLDAQFNHFIRDSSEEVLPDPTPTIVHFNAHPKPWDPRYRNRHCMLWFAEFEALGEVLAPQVLKRLAASFISRARTVHQICASS